MGQQHTKSGTEAVTVSVRSTKSSAAASKGKRKGDTAEQVYNEEIGDREAKRLRKGMSKNKSGRM